MSHLRFSVDPDDHVLGPRNAPISLVEYGDYECPFCGSAFWEVKRLARQLGDRLCFTFRNFPLTEVHPHALQAAEAAEAASAQGYFWPMHDLLYQHQDNLDVASLLSYADALNLDIDRFSEDLENGNHQLRIHRDFMGGVRSGVNGTPCFFINGERHDGELSMEGLLAGIEAQPGNDFA